MYLMGNNSKIKNQIPYTVFTDLKTGIAKTLSASL